MLPPPKPAVTAVGLPVLALATAVAAAAAGRLLPLLLLLSGKGLNGFAAVQTLLWCSSASSLNCRQQQCRHPRSSFCFMKQWISNGYYRLLMDNAVFQVPCRDPSPQLAQRFLLATFRL